MSGTDKYGRCLHAPISLGTTSDDRFVEEGFLAKFARMIGLGLSEKLDGQNDCIKTPGVYARSHVAPSQHPWDKPIIDRWKLIKNDLGDLELFGENMYGVHSIAYKNLDSYFYMFAVREKGRWLSWEEVKFYAEMFDFPTVPEIPIKTPLKDYLIGKEDMDENKVLADWLELNLGMKWEDSINTHGLLGGYDPKTGADASEGFVIRNLDGFETRDAGELNVHENEFANLFKLVRPGHVKTDEHWTKTWKPATLIDYNKYKWYGYEYLSHDKAE